MELLGVIATGMRQLQEVQLKQMEKKDTPEVVKPGISSLPMLDSPGKETSPVDIQDWLEEVGSIMGDLSDTSHEWWKAVREVAGDHYKRWVTATPMEKLALALPKDAKLEHGKYGRVNSRAAGMILGALPTEVKSEMVTKKCTGSSTSLVFKLLTTYRPGGEQEKTLLLEQLTTPEGAATADLAVQALRRKGEGRQGCSDFLNLYDNESSTSSPDGDSSNQCEGGSRRYPADPLRPPTYESIQKQLDEMKLKVLKVKGGPQREDDVRGVLLDSGATHILRPAKSEKEHRESKEAGDASGLFFEVDTGRSAQAALLIAELETRRVDELRQKTADLQDRLNAIRMIEVKNEDWRQNLADYAQEGCVVDGLQMLYKSPIFKDLPEEVLMGMVPNVEVNDRKGWEYLKALPLNRRLRKRLMRSKAWVVNLYGGKGLKEDPVQSLNGQVNVDTNTEVVVINAELLLDGGWCMRGPAYKALMWGAMSSRIKAVIGTPPAKSYCPTRPWRTVEEPYGITGLNPTEMYSVNKETALAARQFLLYLVAHACSKEKFVGWMMKNPGDPGGSLEAKSGISVWNTPMTRAFMEVVAPLGVTTTTWKSQENDASQHKETTIGENLNLKELLKDDVSMEPAALKLRRTLTIALQEAGVASTRTWEPAAELQRMTAEQGWRLHVQRDHVPFRKDCEYCVMMMGTGKQRRRTKQKSAYVLSVDVGGPMRVRSKDTHGSGYRFFLAAAYSRPMYRDQPDPPEPAVDELASAEYDFSDLELEDTPEDIPAPDEDVMFPGTGELGELGEMDAGESDEEVFPPELRAMKAADRLWDDDEAALEEQTKDAADETAVEGNHEIPVDHLYFVRPLKSKNSKHVMMAIQEIVLQLKQENLPVVRPKARALRATALPKGQFVF
ncbi:GIP [Symbiodinium sp. KB8]|nr:GIP [Symbiodinium sp. KB8]